MTPVAALYVQTNGCYFGLDGVDPWDEARDARRYAGPWPVVAHPPCQRWGRLAKFVESQHGYRVGDDGGCFASALAAVRAYGGVLEHPAYTLAWPAYGLQRPRPGLWRGGPREWVTQVSQVAYEHRARKRTWLLYVGREPPDLDWSEPPASGVVSTTRRAGRILEIPRCERAATPLPFRDLLIALARWSRA